MTFEIKPTDCPERRLRAERHEATVRWLRICRARLRYRGDRKRPSHAMQVACRWPARIRGAHGPGAPKTRGRSNTDTAPQRRLRRRGRRCSVSALAGVGGLCGHEVDQVSDCAGGSAANPASPEGGFATAQPHFLVSDRDLKQPALGDRTSAVSCRSRRLPWECPRTQSARVILEPS